MDRYPESDERTRRLIAQTRELIRQNKEVLARLESLLEKDSEPSSERQDAPSEKGSN